MNLSAKQGGHWYKHDNGVWTAVHQVYKVDGSGLTNTTLAHARKMNLFPSVTGITGVIDAPAINNYRVDQAIKSALTLPREIEDDVFYMNRCFGELGIAAHDPANVGRWCHRNPPRPLLNADESAKLVLIDAEAHSEAAKELGTEIHEGISTMLKENRCCVREDVWTLMKPMREWTKENVTEIHAVEQIVGSLEHGYAGTMDLDCDLKGIGRAVVDWKSQNVKRNGKGPKPEFYYSYGKQLAAYGQAVYVSENDGHPHHSGPGQRQLVSVVIDKAHNGEVFVKVWENPAELWRQFLNNAEAWRFENSYDPRVQP